ncbi:flagellar motor protein MotB [Clostridium sp. P21]|uniref:Flagellar motor protein MotB n=1 Tax=Clostridium muellerianum TaxID=2716538 RepID=A0A7Y0HN55_9CLOT|nr:flagellar motor protein MotB [Clostridium muellerianum]NMM61636.1 flagellar motor protein MotB [Clostridium muellerianum]
MKKKKEEEHENSERWLLSYSDFMTLLMILFVVLYAMSNVDKSKFSQLSQSMSIAMGNGKILQGGENAVNITPTSSPESSASQAATESSKMEDLKQKVDSYLQKNGMKDSANTEIDERGLVVSLKDTLFFDTGRAEVKADSQAKLIELGKILNQLGNSMRIEGHTDNVPIHNEQFNSNWQLSVSRAANVTELLISSSNVDAHKLSAVGYGEYRPILDNSTEEGRARNRRVDIIIVSSKYNKIENNGISSNPIGNVNIGDKPIGDKPIGDNPANVPNISTK